MRLITRFERITMPGYGGERVTEALFLNGESGPTDASPEALWERRGKPAVSRAPEKPAGGVPYQVLATLRVLAPDALNDDHISRVLDEQRETLRASRGAWITLGGVHVRFERDDAFAKEEDSLLNSLITRARERLALRRKRVLLRVHDLVLQNFRGFDQLTLSPSTGSTVLVGVNGSGKSTLLDAAALLLAQLAESNGGPPGDARLTDDDIKNGRETAKIAMTASVGTAPLSWRLGRALGQERPFEQGRVGVESDEVNGCRPIVAHYGVNRAGLRLDPVPCP